MLIGFAVGTAVGCFVCGIPSVKKAMQEIKFVIDKDIVTPAKEFFDEKSKEVKSNCGCKEDIED
jgi:hypothetical protein